MELLPLKDIALKLYATVCRIIQNSLISYSLLSTVTFPEFTRINGIYYESALVMSAHPIEHSKNVIEARRLLVAAKRQKLPAMIYSTSFL